MVKDDLVLKKIIKEDKIKLSLDEKIKDRILKATQIESPYKLKTNQKNVLEQEVYQDCLNSIIRQNYYPDLDYMNRNKDNYDNIQKSINDPPGTLSLNDLNFQNMDNKYIKNQMNINEFQSKYTHKNHVSLLSLTNEDIIKKKEKESWIEEQSIKHNLKRELNVIKMESSSSIDLLDNKIDDELIFNKSQPRNSLMFPNSLNNCKDLSTNVSSNININPRNTRYHYTTDFQKDERFAILNLNNKFKKEQDNNSNLVNNNSNIILNSPLIKNAIKRSLKERKFIDKQLRDSYSYNRRSKGSLSRTTK